MQLVLSYPVIRQVYFGNYHMKSSEWTKLQSADLTENLIDISMYFSINATKVETYGLLPDVA